MKLLVASEFPPDAAGGGAAIVRQMLCLPNSKAEIFWWSVIPSRSSNFGGVPIRRAFCGAPPGKLMPARKLTCLKAWLMEHFWTPLAARDFERTLVEVQPDCIWVIPHNWSILPIHKVLVGGLQRRRSNGQASKVRKWEGRFHTTIQDYPDAHNHSAVWGERICKRLNRMQDDLYRMAMTRDATSLPMLEDLEQRTGSKGLQMLHQGLEREDFALLEEKPEIIGRVIEVRGRRSEDGVQGNSTSKILKIAYAGTILVPEEFASFVTALSQVRKEFPVELHLWGAHSYRSAPWFDPSLIIEHGNLPQSELLTALRQCDWGFIPMSLKDLDPRYNRFSFPTKFITYLAAGLPVIAMGHPHSSVMRMAEAYCVGVNLTTLDAEAVKRLQEALADPGAKAHYRAEIIRCAREQFDASAMRQRLWQAFEGNHGYSVKRNFPY